MPSRPKPGRRMVDTIAMVYDFDGTLTPLPMQEYTILPKLGIHKPIEELMIERMGENAKVVTRSMADEGSHGAAFPVPAREILEVTGAGAE